MQRHVRSELELNDESVELGIHLRIRHGLDRPDTVSMSLCKREEGKHRRQLVIADGEVHGEAKIRAASSRKATRECWSRAFRPGPDLH